MSSPNADAFPGVVEIVVEIPRGSRNKYEYDEEAHVYRLDRVLSSAVFYNFDYGFIEGTRAGDGDHTDALLIIDEPTFTGCHVWARPIECPFVINGSVRVSTITTGGNGRISTRCGNDR